MMATGNWHKNSMETILYVPPLNGLHIGHHFTAMLPKGQKEKLIGLHFRATIEKIYPPPPACNVINLVRKYTWTLNE